MSSLAACYASQDKMAMSAAVYKELGDIQRRVLGPENLATLISMIGQGRAADGDLKSLYKRVIEELRRTDGPEHPVTLSYVDGLAKLYNNGGKFAEAEALWSQSLGIRRRVLGPEHPDTLVNMNDLAFLFNNERRYADAAALHSQTLEIEQRVLGPEHPNTLASMTNLARDYIGEGKFEQAEALESQTLRIKLRVLGPTSFSTIRSTKTLAHAYAMSGKYAQEEALFRQNLANNPGNASVLNDLVWYLDAVPDRRLRRPREALPLARQLVREAPNNSNYYNTLGLAEYRNGLWDDVTTLKRSVELDEGSDPNNFFFLSMVYWKRGDKKDAEAAFERGVDHKDAERSGYPRIQDREGRMFWAEAAELLAKRFAVPTLFEARTEPDRAMATLRHAAAVGQLRLETLLTSPDLAPLRGRADFQMLLRDLRSPAKPPAH